MELIDRVYLGVLLTPVGVVWRMGLPDDGVALTFLWGAFAGAALGCALRWLVQALWAPGDDT